MLGPGLVSRPLVKSSVAQHDSVTEAKSYYLKPYQAVSHCLFGLEELGQDGLSVKLIRRLDKGLMRG